MLLLTETRPLLIEAHRRKRKGFCIVSGRKMCYDKKNAVHKEAAYAAGTVFSADEGTTGRGIPVIFAGFGAPQGGGPAV